MNNYKTKIQNLITKIDNDLYTIRKRYNFRYENYTEDAEYRRLQELSYQLEKIENGLGEF